jgi:hypothetical protein
LFDLVSVFCHRDLKAQLLQLSSIARYVSRGALGEMVLVANGGFDISDESLRNLMKSAAGDLPFVLVTHRDLDVPDSLADANGWLTQQALKLEVVRLCRSPRYVVLDAKNHFVAPFVESDLISGDRFWATLIEDRGAATETFSHCYDFLEVPASRRQRQHVAVHTPFVFERALALELAGEVALRSGKSLTQVLFDQPLLSEFGLYQAFAARLGLSIVKPLPPGEEIGHTIFWFPGTTPGHVTRSIEKARSGSVKVFGVHWVQVYLLAPAQRLELAQFWLDRGLTTELEEGVELISWQNRNISAGALSWLKGFVAGSTS